MVAERSITVKLKLDKSDFSRGLKEAATEAKKFKAAMESGRGGGGSAFSDLGDDADDFSTSVDKATDSTKAFKKELGGAGNDANKFSDHIGNGNSRLALMVQYGIALGPAIVPALAAAAPLAAALGSSLAVASVAGGTAILAFQGVGDALKAMNDYAIDPTEEHLQKLQETMDTLGPAGQEFVVFLQELRPEIQKLQNVAQEGMFPGLQEGIESLMTQMPLITQLIDNTATALGDMAAEGGEALTNPFWTRFFEYLRDDGTEILRNLGTGFGKFFEGISALILDFAPLTNDWIASFADAGRSFSNWAQNLPNTQGFQEFMQYLRDTGPEVVQTIGALSKALLDIAVALSGAPAEASLKILQGLAAALGGIASSPIGPSILTLAVGLATLSRALALYNTAKGSALLAFLGSTGTKTGLAGALGKVPFSKFGALAGGLVLLTDAMGGFSEKAGVENMVTFAALGAMFGPWGAGIGAAAGAMKDMTDATDDFASSMDTVQTAMEATPANFHAIDAALANSREELESFKDDVDASSVGEAFENLVDPDAWKNTLDGLFGESTTEKMEDWADAAEADAQRFKVTISNLKNQMDDNLFTQDFTGDTNALSEFMAANQEGLDHFKVTWQELDRLSRQKQMPGLLGSVAQSQWDTTTAAIEKYMSEVNTVTGRSKAVGDAIADLGGEAGNTAMEVDTLSAALDDLFSPALAYSQAIDDWKQGLADLNKEIKGTSLSSETTLGRANRDVVRAQVQDMLTLLKTGVAEGALKGPIEVTERMEDMRTSIINTLRDAGVKLPEIMRLLNELHLTPKDVKLIFDKAGIDYQIAKAKELKDAYNDIPKDVRTKVEADGVQADATIKDLMRKYEDLSRKDATTIIKARDSASPILNAIKARLDLLQNKDILVTARYNTINTVTDRHLTSDGLIPNRPRALGGPVRGPGGPRTDSIPAMLSNGEFVVNAKATSRNLPLLFHINAQGFADGGQAGRQISATDIGRRSVRPGLSFMDDLERALRRLRLEAKQTERQENRVTAAKKRSREASERLEEAQKNEHVSKERLRQLQYAQTQATKRQTYEEKQLAKAEGELAKARDKWQQQQQQLLSQAQAVSAAIRSQGDIFGGQGTSTTVGGILAKLRSSANDGIQFRRYIAKLRGMGLDERLIQQLLEQGPTPEGLAAARNLAHASDREVRQLNQQERRLVGVAASTGGLAIRSGNTVVVNMNIKKIETTDVKALERNLPKRVTHALRVARSVG